TFTGTTTLIGSNTLTITNGGLTNFTGKIPGVGTLNLTTANNQAPGGAVVQISNVTNDYSGGTTLTNNGTGVPILTVPAGNTLGSGPLVLAGGNLFASAAVTISNPVIINGTTIVSGTNAINFAGTTTVFAASTLNAND